jgi:Gpi18-like mannosyltransferase
MLMKKFFKTYSFVIVSFLLWILFLWIVQIISPILVPQRDGYIGPIRFANFDGIHYLHIASSGYFQYGEAFFPLYPIIISTFSKVLFTRGETIGMFVSLISFFIGLMVFYKMLYTENTLKAKWAIVLLLVFPTSFFFGAVYSESLFFVLSVSALYFIKQKKWLVAGLFGALASSTRIFGVVIMLFGIFEYLKCYKKSLNWYAIVGIIIVPIGLIVYMNFLWYRTGDPLAFMHVQSEFGANRSNVPIILLPQVVWRYIKIILTAYMKPTPISYLVSISELVVTIFAFAVVWVYRKSTELSYILFTCVILIIPTLTGTFSSMPRYVLSAFPLFMMLSGIYNTNFRYLFVIICVILQIISAALFFQGWFIA